VLIGFPDLPAPCGTVGVYAVFLDIGTAESGVSARFSAVIDYRWQRICLPRE
jgi:hypothetical protein